MQFSCNECFREYKSEAALRKHTKLKHTDRKDQIFKCTECPSVCKQAHTLKEHFRDKHKIEKTIHEIEWLDNDEKPKPKRPKRIYPIVTCSCGTTNKGMAVFKRHVEKMHGSKDHKKFLSNQPSAEFARPGTHTDQHPNSDIHCTDSNASNMSIDVELTNPGISSQRTNSDNHSADIIHSNVSSDANTHPIVIEITDPGIHTGQHNSDMHSTDSTANINIDSNTHDAECQTSESCMIIPLTPPSTPLPGSDTDDDWHLPVHQDANSTIIKNVFESPIAIGSQKNANKWRIPLIKRNLEEKICGNESEEKKDQLPFG